MSKSAQLRETLRAGDLHKYDGLSNTQRQAMIEKGLYPKPYAISERARGWWADEIIEWQQASAAGRKWEPKHDRSSPSDANEGEDAVR
jgi:predicted DNA-binding transcriptional regulator AlpA